MADAIWNNNYILSNDRPDTMYTSGLEYDANDKISGYAGSAFKAGDTYSAGDNISIANNEISVTGTEDLTLLPISGVNGISITNNNGVITFSGSGSTDETVLWSGTFSGSTGSSNYITLSEATTNFNTIEITMGGGYKTKLRYDGAATMWQVFSPYVDGANGTVVYAGMYIVTNNGTRVYSNPWVNINSNGWTTDTNMNVGEQQMTKVVGIGRK